MTIDPSLEMFVEATVRETRHSLRNEMTTIAAAQANAALQATKEHGEVRSEIQALRADLASLRRDLSDVLPLREAVADLRHRDDIDDARAQTGRDLLSEMTRQRVQFRNFMLAVLTLLVGVAGVVAVLA